MLLNFAPFPTLSTERLVLRRMDLQDAYEIFILRSDDRVLKFTEVPKAFLIDDARKFIEKINSGIDKNEWILWAINLKDNDTLIGTICLWNISKEKSTAEIGYVLLPDYWGKGIMQEAMVKVIYYGFETMKLKAIEADVHPENSSSTKLLERNKFILSAKSDNTVIYSLVNPDSAGG